MMLKGNFWPKTAAEIWSKTAAKTAYHPSPPYGNAKIAKPAAEHDLEKRRKGKDPKDLELGFP